MARPPTPPDLIAEALSLLAPAGGSMTPEGAAEEMARRGRPVSSRTIRRAMDKTKPKGWATEEQRAASPPTGPVRAPPPSAPRAVAEPEDGEEGLDDLEVDAIPTLARVRKLMALVERKLVKAPPDRFTALGTLLEKLYVREKQLLPAPVAPPDAVTEELRRLDFEAIRLIEQFLPPHERATAQEIAA